MSNLGYHALVLLTSKAIARSDIPPFWALVVAALAGGACQYFHGIHFGPLGGLAGTNV